VDAVTRTTASVARHTLAYATGSIVGGITRAVLLPIAARRLTSEEFGVYSLLLAATNLVHLLFELGLVTALIKFHSEAPDPLERRRLRSLLFLGMPAIDLLIAAPLVVFRDLISQVLFGTPAYGGLVAIATVIAFFGAQLQLFLGHLRADDRSRDFVILMALRGAISLVATYVLVLAFDLGIPGFLLGNLAGSMLVTLAMTPRLLLRQRVDLSGARSRLRDVLRFGAPLVPAALGLWALTHLDAYLLRVFSGLASVGRYNFAAELCLPIALLMNAIQLAWPTFAFSRARDPDGPAHIARVFRHLYVALVGGALAVALLRREALRVLGTDSFRGSLDVVPLLALSTCLYAAAQWFGTGLQVAGQTRRFPPLIALAIAVNAGLNVILIPPYQELGAAGATVATNAALTAAVLAASQKAFHIPFELRRSVLVLVSAGLVFGAGELLGEIGLVAGIAARGILLLGLYPVALAGTGAVSFAELRALPRILGEIARPPARGSVGV
jgi:O-antigen/teichoic acid export membrane protein